jgi:hypothetical protein
MTTIEHRYEEVGNTYTLRSWAEGQAEKTRRGRKGHRPAWLREIIDVAMLGGHLYAINTPPPDVLVWFHTDERNLLLSFPTDLSTEYQTEIPFSTTSKP